MKLKVRSIENWRIRNLEREGRRGGKGREGGRHGEEARRERKQVGRGDVQGEGLGEREGGRHTSGYATSEISVSNDAKNSAVKCVCVHCKPKNSERKIVTLCRGIVISTDLAIASSERWQGSMTYIRHDDLYKAR